MKEILQYENQNSLVYLLVNNYTAMDMVQSFLDNFIEERNNEALIFIAYHVTGDVILLHGEAIEKGTSFTAAVQRVRESIERGDLRADDANLKKALGDPQATTAKFLLDYIRFEGY